MSKWSIFPGDTTCILEFVCISKLYYAASVHSLRGIYTQRKYTATNFIELKLAIIDAGRMKGQGVSFLKGMHFFNIYIYLLRTHSCEISIIRAVLMH